MKRRTTKRPRERVPAGPEARPVAPTAASSLLVVVDPRPLTRQSLAEMLGRTLSDFNVVAVSSCDELMSGTGRPGLKPGLILLNPSLGGAGGEWTHNALKWLKRWLPTVPVIVLSDRDAPEELDNLLDLGVRGYLPPSAEPAVVFAAVRLVHAGGTCIPIHLLGEARRAVHRHRGMHGLTEREMSVVKFLGDGAPNKVIATALGMQEGTVKVHIRSIMRKLRVANRTQVALIARQLFE
jgi:DNA-binding NarL/FixJ family response regulator